MVISYIAPQALYDEVRLAIQTLETETGDPENLATKLSDGSLDTQVKGLFINLSASAADMISERYAMVQALSEDYESYWNELYFFSDMYTEIVMAVISYGLIRTSDLAVAEPDFYDLVAAISSQMADLEEVETLNRLRNYILQNQASWLAKPNFRLEFQKMITAKQGVYVVRGPKDLEDYSNSDVIATVSDFVDVDSAAQGTLPPGTALDGSYNIVVTDKDQLVSGRYRTIMDLGETGGGYGTVVVEMQIGDEVTARYEIYDGVMYVLTGTDIAWVTAENADIVSARLVSGQLPHSSTLDTATGTISVTGTLSLRSGDYQCEIETTDSLGRVQLHSLTFHYPDDQPSEYFVKPPRLITEYENGDVLAEVSDPDGVMNAVNVQSAPFGMSINGSTGEITVSDAGALIPGLNYASIQITDADGNIHDQLLEITIGFYGTSDFDYYAVAAQALGSYSPGDVLAYPADAMNNPLTTIAHAKFLRGQMPPGTGLNQMDGSVSVLRTDLLIPGRYTFTVQTIDVDGGVVEKEVTIPISTEAKYYVFAPRNENSYVLNELLAYPVSPEGDVTAAVLDSGSLPAGVALNSTTGELTVSDPSLITDGSTTFGVETTDDGSLVSVTTITLVFKDDQTPVWTVATAKNVRYYENGEVIATVSDPDGDIVKAEVTGGALPSGLVMDAVTGEITVSDVSLLVGSVYSGIKITTTDVTGGKYESTISIEFYADLDATYTVYPAKPADYYSDSDVLAEVDDPDGDLLSAQLLSGRLPNGAKLDTSTGAITVNTATKIREGSYTATIQIRDVNGGLSQTDVTITILADADAEAEYVVNAAKNVDAYVNSDVIAYPTDPDGSVTSASIQTGTLPAGLSFSTSTGTVTVSDATSLVAGNYLLKVNVTDSLGGTDLLDLAFSILPDNDAVYIMSPVKAVGLYSNDDVIATPTDPDGAITSATVFSGSMPAGLSMSSSTGVITVSDSGSLGSGSTALEIDTVDSAGGKSRVAITIVIPTDSPGMYAVEPARNIHSYRDSDVLATASDADGSVTAASVIVGSLPAGCVMDPNNGEITVSDRDSLVEGSTTFTVELTDSGANTTDVEVTLSFRDYDDDPADFVEDACDRLDELDYFESAGLAAGDATEPALLAMSKIAFDRICEAMADDTLRALYASGAKDAEIESDFEDITDPVKEFILAWELVSQTATGDDLTQALAILSLYVALYNEQIVSLVELVAARDEDLSSDSSTPLNQLFTTLIAQMTEMTAISELDYFRDNLTALKALIVGKPRLKAKLTSMIAA